ncbi:MAG: HIT family protein [Sarcina sp.]
MECLFCKIANKKLSAHIVYEDTDIISFLDIDPINEGHILIVPKKHYLDIDEIPNELLYKIMLLSKKISIALKKAYTPDGYSIMQNGGKFNDIGHYHMHIFPRYLNDEFNWTFSDKQHNVNIQIAKKLKKVLK